MNRRFNSNFLAKFAVFGRFYVIVWFGDYHQPIQTLDSLHRIIIFAFGT